jgi:anti-anti-sigma regulatory factor
MDTYGAQLFLELIQRIGRAGGKVVTFGANEMIVELLRLLSVDQFIENFPTEKEALSRISENAG